MPKQSRAGTLPRTVGEFKQVNARIARKSFDRLRAVQARHRLSFADLIELVILHMTDSEISQLVRRDMDARVGEGSGQMRITRVVKSVPAGCELFDTGNGVWCEPARPGTDEPMFAHTSEPVYTPSPDAVGDPDVWQGAGDDVDGPVYPAGPRLDDPNAVIAFLDQRDGLDHFAV